MSSQARRQLGLECLQLGVGVSRDEVGKGGPDAREESPASLERHEGVLERRRLWVTRDLPDLCLLLLHPTLEGREEVLVADAVEVRHPQRQGALDEERVHVTSGRVRVLIHRHAAAEDHRYAGGDSRKGATSQSRLLPSTIQQTRNLELRPIGGQGRWRRSPPHLARSRNTSNVPRSVRDPSRGCGDSQ